jgi:TatD DNase family protein
VLAVGEGADDNLRVLEASRGAAPVFPCLGLHPDRFENPCLDTVTAQIRRHAGEIVAIGEVGLDYWRAREEPGRAVQREVLSALVGLAAELDLTLNVHSRSAGHHTLALLEDRGAGRVHMHAYDGKAHPACLAAERGVFFSIPPSVLRSPQKQKLVKRLPLEQMLLESDAPVLGPVAGERNEPANLRLSLEYVATARGVPEAELDGILEANTLRAYPRLRERLSGRKAGNPPGVR